MAPLLSNLQLAAPEIIMLVTACLALLGDLFLKPRINNIAYYVALLGLALSAVISFVLLNNYPSLLFNGLFISDDVAQLMKLFISISVFLGFFYSKNYIEERQIPEGDYYILGLFSTLGMMVLVSAHSLLSIYLGVELLSLPLYAMTAIRRTNSNAAEAALKYFVMGAIASGMLLYGFALIYGATGKLDLVQIASVISTQKETPSALLSFALVFVLAGVGFKLAAVPFHMWAPDVYQGAPTTVTLLISTAPKIAALGMAFRLLTLALVDVAVEWQHILLVMSLLSAGVGNIVAVVQTNLKRLFAYSAISHLGYALFGILAATTAGYTSALYYVLVYSIMTVGVFGLLALLSKNGLEVENIDDLKGLNKRNPWLAFLMMIMMFSMAGVPPTVGFFIKLLVLKALVDANMTWVAVLGLLFAVIGAYYYIKVVKVMYFDDPRDTKPIALTRSAQLVFSLNGLSLLYFGIFPSVLINACVNAFS